MEADPVTIMNVQTTRKRLSWDDRHRQMIGVALDYVRREGADSLTLSKVAEQAGVPDEDVRAAEIDEPELVERFFRTLQTRFLEVFHPFLITTRAYRLL